ncbi:MAG TPA: XrtB/PEP-CTERM-associated polysaccharide biosynthesis outer membrane protein EpsL [Telluria sp.]|nr:XrtB/PEP-CTERM-associated polysaccharide biosynthesis outer membrane protein EpsL [Telluria sp.]
MLSYLPTKSSLLLLAAALAGAHANAAPTDALHVFGGLGYGHDDNLLRVPDGVAGFDNQLGDSWYQADAGLLFDHTYSRQRLSAQARLSKVKFDHFSQLDYDGKDLEATWDWQVGNHLEGKLGATYDQTLAPYTDFHSDQRNLREQRRTYVDGAWRFHPSYRVRAGASKEKSNYELVLQSYNDRTEDAWEIGADYLPASGSEIGLVARKVKGKYPNRRPFGQQLLNDDYDQDELKARISWIASGSTNVQLLAGWVRRRQPGFGDDTSGFNGRIAANYQRHNTLAFTAAVWRDFAPIESTIVSYTLNKGASAGLVWDASTKVKVDANAVVERRDYNPRLLAMAALGDLNDVLRSANVRATWSPRTAVQLSAAFAHQARSGSAALGTGRLSSNSIELDARAQF